MPLRLLLTLLAASICISCASHGTRHAEPRPEDSVVRIDTLSSDGKFEQACSGTVLMGGRVATALDSVQSAKEVWVTTRTGHRCRVAGVAGSNKNANLILLTVNWRGEIPPPFRMADPSPSGPVSILPGPGFDSLTPVPSQVSNTNGDSFDVPVKRALDFRYFGAPVVDANGLLVGVAARLTMGVQVAVSTQPVEAVNFYTAYGLRVLGRLDNETQTPWTQWAAGRHER